MKEKILFAITFILLFSSVSFSQNYQTAIGFRGASFYSGSGGINLKHFVSPKNALEITLGGGRNHLVGSALYEWQNSTDITPGLDWYLGVGGVFGTWRYDYVHPSNKDYKYSNGFYLGGRAVVGLDYTLTDIPLNFAFDAGPYIGIINSGTIGWGGSFTIRYVLN